MTSTFPRKLPRPGVLGLTAAAGLAVAVSLGCGRSEAAPPRGAATTTSATVGATKVESETFVVEIKAAGPYTAGKEGVVEITLETKGAYHTNAQYPYKFKTPEPPPEGVTYPKPVLARGDGSFDEKKGSFKLPFVVAKAGKAKVGGKFSLSVCSEANCIMDKVDLEVEVEAK